MAEFQGPVKRRSAVANNAQPKLKLKTKQLKSSGPIEIVESFFQSQLAWALVFGATAECFVAGYIGEMGPEDKHSAGVELSACMLNWSGALMEGFFFGAELTKVHPHHHEMSAVFRGSFLGVWTSFPAVVEMGALLATTDTKHNLGIELLRTLPHAQAFLFVLIMMLGSLLMHMLGNKLFKLLGPKLHAVGLALMPNTGELDAMGKHAHHVWGYRSVWALKLVFIFSCVFCSPERFDFEAILWGVAMSAMAISFGDHVSDAAIHAGGHVETAVRSSPHAMKSVVHAATKAFSSPILAAGVEAMSPRSRVKQASKEAAAEGGVADGGRGGGGLCSTSDSEVAKKVSSKKVSSWGLVRAQRKKIISMSRYSPEYSQHAIRAAADTTADWRSSINWSRVRWEWEQISEW
jgi:hypothetical protein